MVTNRVYKVLVTTGGAAAANVAAVTAGKYAVLKKDGTVFTAGDTITAGDEFQIVVAGPDGSKVFSDLIRLKDVTTYEKQVYRARVEQVVTAVPDTPVAGQEYTLSILDYSDKEILQRRQNKRSYSVIAATGETATTLAGKFRTNINNDPAVSVTASGSGANIVLTADAVETTPNIIGEFQPQIFFDVFFSATDAEAYLTKFGTVTKTTPPDYGSGNYDQIRRLEQRGQGYVGVTNRTHFPVESGQYLSVLGTTYDVLVIQAERTYESNSATFGLVQSPVTLIIAVTAGQSTALEAILTPLIGSAPNEALTVEG